MPSTWLIPSSWLVIIAALAVAAACIWVYRFYSRSATSRNDRYLSERIMVPEHASMLAYLQETFPGQTVLPQIKLKDMLSVRRATDSKRARRRLNGYQVDFVVCNADGRPMFAFDIEQHHLSDVQNKSLKVSIKKRMLKTAGVRLVFLKNSVARMPPPSAFRQQLDLDTLSPPTTTPSTYTGGSPSESALRELESKFSELDEAFTITPFRDAHPTLHNNITGLEVVELNHDPIHKSQATPPTLTQRA